MALLSLVFLALFVASLGSFADAVWQDRIDLGLTIIWGLFLAEFVVKLAISPRRSLYLRRNWFDLLVIILPAFRILRAARALRALRGIGPVVNLLAAGKGFSLFRLALVFRRGGRSVHRFLRASRFGYVAGVTVLVVVLVAAFVLMFERNAPNSEIKTMGDALWWSAAVCTTVACGLDPVTPGGRVLAVFLMVYGMAVFGYFISRAVLFIHRERIAEIPGGRESPVSPETRRANRNRNYG